MAAKAKKKVIASSTAAKSKPGRSARDGNAGKTKSRAARPAATTTTAKASLRAKPATRRSNAGDWRADTLARMRTLIAEADPAIVEERKWAKASTPLGVPVWSHDGIVCTGETYKNVVKLTFARGASLPDPSRLFNSSLQGGTRRAIDIHEGESVDAAAFKALVRAAVENNVEAKKR